MPFISKLVPLLILLTFLIPHGQMASAAESAQSRINPHASPQHRYPKIVLYSVSWCPHCKAAKEYLTSHDIPFINKDVEDDPVYMKELTQKYRSEAVPLIVLGNDTIILKGFDRDKLEKAIRKLQKKGTGDQ